MNDIHLRLVKYYDDFAQHTQLGHEEAQKRRDYYDGIQYSAEEKAILRKRKQPIVVDNRIKRKVDYLLGVERQTRTDPKCFPRTPQDDEASQAFTDAIRFVCDNNDWDIERSEAFDNLCVEGIEAYVIDVENIGGDYQVKLKTIPWNRFVYDPHSSDRFFRDSKYKGILTWMDKEDALGLFPDGEDALTIEPTQDNNSLDDRPNETMWLSQDRKRVLIIELYYLDSGVWNHAIFTKAGFLKEPSPSEFKDEFNRPMCNIEAGGAFIDKDNDRYGIVRQMMSPQDEINKRRSKYLHLLSTRQTFGNDKAVQDVNKAKIELSKPDGHVEVNGNAQYGVDFGTLPTNDMGIGQFNLLQDALNSIEGMGQGDIVDSSASGRSKEISQNSNLIELGPLFDTHRQVSKLVYKQIFYRIKQFWTGHRFVRITDDERNVKFTELNKEMTGYDMAVEKVGEQQAQKIAAANPFDPRLREVVHKKNDVSQITVDIFIEDAPDIVNIQSEQFELLAKMYQASPNSIPLDMVIEASQLRNKGQIIEHLRGGDEAAQQARMQAQQQEQQFAQAAKETQLQGEVAKTKETEAKARKYAVEAEAQEIENLLATAPLRMPF